jgi:hypothetical protein
LTGKKIEIIGQKANEEIYKSDFQGEIIDRVGNLSNIKAAFQNLFTKKIPCNKKSKS